MLEFSVPSNELTLSTVFANLKDAKELLQLQDFFVSQTTLDQVSQITKMSDFFIVNYFYFFHRYL